MVGLLILTTGLMYRLSDPAFISSAFRNLGAPLDAPASTANAVSTKQSGDPGLDGRSLTPEGVELIPQSVRQASLWLEAFRKGSVDVHRDLAEHFLAPLPSESKFAEITQLWAEAVEQEQKFETLGDIVGKVSEQDTELFLRWLNDWKDFRACLAQSSLESLKQAKHWDGFELALDRMLLENIRDASVWRSFERSTLLRHLDRAHQLLPKLSTTSQSTPIRSVLLSASPETYRGSFVRMRGKVVLEPKTNTLEDPYFGSLTYHVLWIDPADESTQPVCLFSIDPFPWDAASPETSEIEFEGLFLKRLAYRSKRGADVAPLLIGRIVTAERMETAETSEATIAIPRLVESVNPVTKWQRMARIQTVFTPLVRGLIQDKKECQLLAAQAPRPPSEEALQLLFQFQRWQLPSPWNHDPIEGLLPVKEIVGIAKKVETIPLPSPTAEWMEASEVYRVTLEDHSTPKPRTYYAWSRSVPSAWKKVSTLHQPCTVRGMELDESHTQGPPVLFVDQLQWQWSSDDKVTNLQPALNPEWGWLGESGWDLAQRDRILALQKQALQVDEFPHLMQLVKIAPQFPRSFWSQKREARGLEVGTILRNPDKHVFDRIRTRVRVLRVARIEVPTPTSAQALEGKYYFEVDGLADLGVEGPVRFQRKPNDPEPSIFEHEFPVTLLCREIPTWLMDDQDINNLSITKQFYSDRLPSDVWYPRREVLVDGIFYRLWQYSNGRSADLDQMEVQLAPLIACSEIRLADTQSIRRVRQSLDQVGLFLVVTLVAAIGVIWQATRIGKRKRGLRPISSSLSTESIEEDSNSE